MIDSADQWTCLGEIDVQVDEDGWYRADEFEDVANSLKILDFALTNVVPDACFWKVAILSAHSALQGACVCILTRTDGTGALAENKEKEMMNKLYGESEGKRNLDDDTVEWQEEFIASLPELLKRLPGELRTSMTKRSAKKYPISPSGDLRRLQEFRNKLTHFPPISWSLEIVGIPRIILCAVDLTERISSSADYKSYNRFLEMDLSSLFNDIRQSLQAVEKENRQT